jgi:hypothetical protein
MAGTAQTSLCPPYDPEHVAKSEEASRRFPELLRAVPA